MKRKMYKSARILAVGLMTTLTISSLAACSNDSGDSDYSADNDTITLVDSGKFDHFYCVPVEADSTNAFGAYFLQNCYDTLVTYDSEGNIVGQLAEDWTISEDGTVYTFNLRDNVKFSDGTPLTASIVKESIDSANENLESHGFLGSYGYVSTLFTSEDTVAIDEDTFQITLSAPYYGTLNDLSLIIPYGITNASAFTDGADGAYTALKSTSNGTGPYMVESTSDSLTTFVLNPNYWGTEPEVKTVNVKVISDNTAKVTALRSGEIDGIIGVNRFSYDGFAELQNSDEYGTLINSAALKSNYFNYRFRDIQVAEYDESGSPTGNYTVKKAGVFKDILVRQAAAYAIDQQTIVTNILNGLETAAETMFSPDLPYCDVDSIKIYETDIDKANELLSEAGWELDSSTGVRTKDGNELAITIEYCKTVSSLDSAMEAVKSQLEAVGFNVTLTGHSNIMDWYTSAMYGNFDLMLWPTNGGTMDPGSTVTNMSSSSYGDPLLSGLDIYFSEDVSIEKLNTATTEEDVQNAFTEIFETIADDCYTLPFIYINQLAAWNSSKIENYTFYMDPEYITFANIDLVD